MKNVIIYMNHIKEKNMSKINIEEWKKKKEKELEDLKFNETEQKIEFNRRRLEQIKYGEEYKPISKGFWNYHYVCPFCGKNLEEIKISQGTVHGQSMHGNVYEIKHDRFLLNCKCGYKYAQNRYPFRMLEPDN